jgi:hypothetical protein
VWSVRTDLSYSRTQAALPIANLAVNCPDELVLRSDEILLGIFHCFLFQPVAHHCIFIDLSCHVVWFSHGFLPRFWHSLHISSYSVVISLSSSVLLSFCVFQNIWIFVDWNIFLRYCAWKSYSVYVLGWYLYICAIWIAIFAFVIFGHPIDSRHNTIFFLN